MTPENVSVGATIVWAMYSEQIERAYAAVTDAVAQLDDLPVELMTATELLDAEDHREHVVRLLCGVGRRTLARLDEVGTADFGGGGLGLILADRLRITTREAGRRIHEAADLAGHTLPSGERVPPALPFTADAERDGRIGAGHIKEIRDFMRALPAAVDPQKRAEAEQRLAELSTWLRPDEVKECAQRMAALLNPDDEFDDRDRARKRYVTMRPQGIDKMRSGTFCVTPEVGAYLEAIFAKLAAPGMCHPDDPAPVVNGAPDRDAASKDGRSAGQRQHDALATICRDALASGRLGSHRGLPVTVIATATVAELQRYTEVDCGGNTVEVSRTAESTECTHPGSTGGAPWYPAAGPAEPTGCARAAESTGFAGTGGGSLLPIRDLIRMAAGSLPYLAVFDDHTNRPLYFGRAKRLANPDQRMALYATDRGCTYPGCPSSAYVCESHHVTEWADGGSTDIDNLTLVCPMHHRMIGTDATRWRTTKDRGGQTRWTPPHHVDPTGRSRVNSFHHPGGYISEPSESKDVQPP